VPPGASVARSAAIARRRGSVGRTWQRVALDHQIEPARELHGQVQQVENAVVDRGRRRTRAGLGDRGGRHVEGDDGEAAARQILRRVAEAGADVEGAAGKWCAARSSQAAT